jgi:hypothetical protein
VTVLERAASLFLASAGPQSAVTATLPPATRAVVLGAPRDAAPLAAALALRLRAADRAPAALVAEWHADAVEAGPAVDAERGAAGGGARAAGLASPAGPMLPAGVAGARAGGLAAPAARRLAAGLTSHALAAVARGRLAWLALPADPVAAAAALRRAAAVVDGPLVTALAGPRPAELEPLVAVHDLAVVAADPETPLARAAVSHLSARGVTALACPPLRRGIPRAAALAGLGAARLDRALRIDDGRVVVSRRDVA